MSWSTGLLLKKDHIDVECDARHVAAVMDLARRDIHAEVERSGSPYTCIDSPPITGGLRAVTIPAWDRVDGQATRRHNIFRDDVYLRWSLGLHQGQLPGYGTRDIVDGIGARYGPVRVKYEIAAAGTAEDQAKAGCNGLRHRESRERDIKRGQQYAANQYCPDVSEPALRSHAHVQGTIG